MSISICKKRTVYRFLLPTVPRLGHITGHIRHPCEWVGIEFRCVALGMQVLRAKGTDAET